MKHTSFTLRRVVLSLCLLVYLLFFSSLSAQEQAVGLQKNKIEMTESYSTPAWERVTNENFIQGFRYGKFVTQRRVYIKELNCHFVELIHEPTQAVIINIQNSDPENLFCLAFQTLPYSSNGVAHVLEHMVLCGSDKYPAKNTFFNMERRTVATYMNAFTADDYTCYVSASQNKKDFYNLLGVYLDAVFYPKLDHFSFLQEAHRLEFSKSDDSSSLLVRKGVVYNEMKAMQSSPEDIASSLLFPDTPYTYKSGGDPEIIPTLTLNEVKKFHRENYHPSRCLFYFYGSLPLVNHLEFLEEQLLCRSTKTSKPTPIPLQPKFSEPIRKVVQYHPQKMRQSDVTSFAWLTCDCKDIDTTLAVAILSSMLFDSDVAPLPRKIFDSGIAKDVRASVDIMRAEIPFFITLTEAKGSLEEIESTIDQFFKEIASHGFDQREIERVLDGFELLYKSDTTLCGLTLFEKSVPLYFKGVDPLLGLEVEKSLDRIRQKVADNPAYFSELMQQFLINNNHKVVLKITKDGLDSDKLTDVERAQLDQLQGNLTEEAKDSLIEQAKKLEVYQKEAVDTSSLPAISLEDIGDDIKLLQYEYEQIQDVSCYFSNVFTKGIDYISVAVPIPPDLLKKPQLFTLYCMLFRQMGCGDKSWEEAVDCAQQCTDGLSVMFKLYSHANDPNQIAPYFHISGRSLAKNTESLIHLMFDYVENPRFDDVQRVEELIKRHYLHLTGSFSPIQYRSITKLESLQHHSLSNKLLREMNGLPYLYYVRDLVNQWDNKKEALLSELKEIVEEIRQKSVATVIASTERANIEAIKKYIKKRSVRTVKRDSDRDTSYQFSSSSVNRFIAIEGLNPVSFSTLSIPAMHYKDPKSAYATLLAALLKNLHLHPKIREQGGAYGSSAVYDNGALVFINYRDPHIWKSYRICIESLESVAKGDFTEEDLDNAKRVIIQEFDAPEPVSSSAEIAFTYKMEGLTDEFRRQFRKRLFDATCQDIREVAVALQSNLSNHSFATVAHKQLLEKELELFSKEGIEFEKFSL